jgi:uncharacterized protein YndB with AHSA1/START domain
MEDRIEREIVIAAPVEQVWAVLTEPAHIGSWFGNGTPARVDLRPGGRIVYDHGHGDLPAVIEQVEAPRFLSYRWAIVGEPGQEPTQENSTLIEYTLTPDGDHTRLHVAESGFEEVAQTHDGVQAQFEGNTAHWPEILERARQHSEQLVAR